MAVSIDHYPKSVEWDNKVYSMPNIPRGEEGMLPVLREILLMVSNHASPSQKLNIKGSSSKITLNEACVRLRPMRLVLKTANGWEITEEARIWLESGDDLYLAAMFCANIRFLSEILFYLDTPKTASELQAIARGDYALNWKTRSDINSRLVWLRQFGLVEFQDFSLLYHITEKGRIFLNTVEVSDPILVDFSQDSTENETLIITDWGLELTRISHSKKPSIGYIPGIITEFDRTILSFIQILEGGAEYNQILSFAQNEYNIAESSVRSFLTTLSNMGFAERKTDILFGVTDTAKKWLLEPNKIDLLCVFHSKFKFIFEMLSVLKETNMTFKELAATAKVSYGFDRESVDEIRKRIYIFKAAKLVKNASVDSFTITEKGRKLLELLDIPEHTNREENETAVDVPENNNEDFFTELRLAARDSSNFERLERAVQTAFERLGFHSQWLGGSGKTDVLIQSHGAAGNGFSVTIDAKSTTTGNVNDGLVDFDTILEHKNKHHATYAAIIGGRFQNERLINRAKQHGVVLIDVDTLELLIKKHEKIPVPTTAYKSLFESSGIADVSGVENEQKLLLRQGNLIFAVVECLADESFNPDTQGILYGRDIYFSLRKDSRFDVAPTVEEITAILDFLSSPLIGCVGRKKDAYYATGTLAEASQKFSFYASLCRR